MHSLSRYITLTFVVIEFLTLRAVKNVYAASPDWQLVTVKDNSALSAAVIIGVEESLPLYACRAVVGGGTQPGRFRNDFSGCHIGYAGQELSVVPFEILATSWQAGTEGSISPGSIRAGQRIQSKLANRFGLISLHPCRVVYQGGQQLGEVAQGDLGCNFGYGGRQVTEKNYQVLWGAPWMAWIEGIAHQIPDSAIIGGRENEEPMYMCLASDKNGIHPGKIKMSSTGCSIASGGKEIVQSQFLLLVPRWLPGSSGTTPLAALPVGQDREDILYLCRAKIRNSTQIGRISDQLAMCHVGMMGREVSVQSYDVLSER